MNDDIKVTLDEGTVQFGQLKIGEVKTGEAGTKAAVTNSGSSARAVLNFIIPKGDKGDAYILTEDDKIEIELEISKDIDDSLKRTKHFNSVAEMKSDNLLNSSCIAKTLGYYEANDGGGATYLIRLKNENDVEDNGSIHFLENGLVAELVIENEKIIFEQLGAKSDDRTFDCKNYLLNYINICNLHNKTYELFIGQGIWYFSPTLIYRKEGVRIVGIKTFKNGDKTCTQISPINSSQSYIWKLGGLENIDEVSTDDTIVAVRSTYIDGLVFAGVDSSWSKLESALYIDCCMYCTFDNLYFENICGTALTIRQSWELHWGIVNFRGISNFEKPCVHIPPTTNPWTTVGENVSANYFNYMMFEGIDGDYIYSEGQNGFEHNEINNMQIEVSVCKGQGDTITTDFTENTISERDNMTKHFIFKGFARYFVINTINLFIEKGFYATNNGKKYVLAGIIGNDENETSDYYSSQDIAINTIKIGARGNKYNPVSIVYSHNPVSTTGLISIQCVHWFGQWPTKPFDFEGGCSLRIGQIAHGSHQFGVYDNCCKGISLYKVAHRRSLYYDAESLNELNLVVKGNIEKNDISLAYMTINNNKSIKLRLKGAEGVSYKFRLQGLVNGAQTNKYFDYVGTGKFEYYTCSNLGFDDGSFLQLIGAISSGTSLAFDTLELLDETIAS